MNNFDLKKYLAEGKLLKEAEHKSVFDFVKQNLDSIMDEI